MKLQKTAKYFRRKLGSEELDEAFEEKMSEIWLKLNPFSGRVGKSGEIFHDVDGVEFLFELSFDESFDNPGKVDGGGYVVALDDEGDPDPDMHDDVFVHTFSMMDDEEDVKEEWKGKLRKALDRAKSYLK